MKITDDGIYHVRQSDIETFLNCPEQSRRRMLVADGSRSESDAATVGTALHTVIEHELAGNTYSSLKECKGFSAKTFLELLEEYAANPLCSYSAESFGTHARAMEQLAILSESWYTSKLRADLLHYPTDELNTEWNFDLPFRTDRGDNKPDIWLSGTSDLVFANQVWDWKSTSSMRSYTPWEKQRWAVQPTVYLWAASQAGLIRADADALYQFSYQVFVRGKVQEPQAVRVTRSNQNFNWLARVVENMVHMATTMGTDNEWPLNDHSALCGPKWCPFWDACKGSMIDGETWV